MHGRRSWLKWVGAGSMVAALPRSASGQGPAAGKVADMIVHTDWPLNAEMPVQYLADDLTRADTFFVRWHIARAPRLDVATFRLSVGGQVKQPLSLSLDDLRAMPSMELLAVVQCAGNGRKFFEPRVPGAQWGHGALGQARFRGVPLRGLLKKAGVQKDAVDVSFRGAELPAVAATPRFAKSLAVDHASDGEVMVAWEMNGAPLPVENGFPLRLVVPGWYATYWVKAVESIEVLASPFKGYWMDKAYRVPKTPYASESPEKEAEETIPVARMRVRSLFVKPEAGEKAKVGQAVSIEGIAFDGGSGIKRVEVSIDGGTAWTDATLDPDKGRYAWRRWRFKWTPAASGVAHLVVRATSVDGTIQDDSPRWNHAGYSRELYERMELEVAT